MRADPGRMDFGPLAPIVLAYLRSRADLALRRIDWPVSAMTGGYALRDLRGFLELELGAEAVNAFEWIDVSPIRSTPLSRQFLARTTKGRDVLVKVLRPDAADVVARETPALLRTLAGLGEECRLTPEEISELLNGLRDWLSEEIDLPQEQRNLQRLHGRGGWSHTSFVIPRPRPDLSRGKILTFEIRRGTPLTVLTRSSPAGTREAGPTHMDPTRVAHNLIRSVLHQMFSGRHFLLCADPSAILALPDNRVAFVDFSHLGRVDIIVRRNQFRYVAAIRSADVDRIISAVDELTEAHQAEALDTFAAELRARVRRWQRHEDYARAPAARIAEYLSETVQLARSCGLRFDEPALEMLRALLSADRLAAALSTDSGLGAVAPGFFSADWLRGFAGEIWEERLPSLGFDLVDLLTESPGNLTRILSDLAERRFVLRVQTVESDETRTAAATRAQLLATSALIVGVCVVVGTVWAIGNVPLLAWLLFGTVGAVLATIFVALWRRLG